MLLRLSRYSLVAASLIAGAAPLAAQAIPDRESAVEFRKQFLNDLDTLHSKVIALANAVPAGKYDWRPAPGVRSFGEVFMHIAAEYYVYTPMSFGAARAPVIAPGAAGMKAFEGNTAKDSVLKHLAAGFAYMRTAVMGIDPSTLGGTRKLFGRDFTILETGIGMTADLHEHLGQLIAYARMNGITPPWSK